MFTIWPTSGLSPLGLVVNWMSWMLTSGVGIGAAMKMRTLSTSTWPLPATVLRTLRMNWAPVVSYSAVTCWLYWVQFADTVL